MVVSMSSIQGVFSAVGRLRMRCALSQTNRANGLLPIGCVHISVRAERSGEVCREVEAYQLRFLG